MNDHLLPDEQVLKALTDAHLVEYFNNLSPSHQNEYLRWVYEAKKPDTKQRRMNEMIEMLLKKCNK